MYVCIQNCIQHNAVNLRFMSIVCRSFIAPNNGTSLKFYKAVGVQNFIHGYDNLYVRKAEYTGVKLEGLSFCI